MSEFDQARTRLLSYAAMLRQVAGQIETDVNCLSEQKEKRIVKDASAASTAATSGQTMQQPKSATNDIESTIFGQSFEAGIRKENSLEGIS
jgi:hypothetical protein